MSEYNELPTPVWSGSFMIGDVEMRCHVLSTGERFIEAESVEALFSSDAALSGVDLTELARFIGGGPLPAPDDDSLGYHGPSARDRQP